jgi:hypothetical protein
LLVHIKNPKQYIHLIEKKFEFHCKTQYNTDHRGL